MEEAPLEPGRSGWRAPLEVLLVAGRLGLTCFGGPVAHLGYFREEYVARRRWPDERTFARPGRALSAAARAGEQRAGHRHRHPARTPGRGPRRLARLHTALGDRPHRLRAAGPDAGCGPGPGLVPRASAGRGGGRRPGRLEHGPHPHPRPPAPSDRARRRRPHAGHAERLRPDRRHPPRRRHRRRPAPRAAGGGPGGAGGGGPGPDRPACGGGGADRLPRGPDRTGRRPAPGRQPAPRRFRDLLRGRLVRPRRRPRRAAPAPGAGGAAGLGVGAAVPDRLWRRPGRARAALHLLRLPGRDHAGPRLRHSRCGARPGRDLRSVLPSGRRVPALLGPAAPPGRLPVGAQGRQRGRGRDPARRPLRPGLGEHGAPGVGPGPGADRVRHALRRPPTALGGGAGDGTGW